MDASAVEDLEIVAGYVWSAVGGVDDGVVEVKQVDPKRFGVEVAASTEASWAVADNGNTKKCSLSTLRPFKPMDMIIIERLNDGDGEIALVTGYTDISKVEIGGVNQFTAEENIPSVCFGTAFSAPRPKIRFDTVQTSPSLSIQLVHVGSTIGASETLTGRVVFGGVAVKR